MADLWVRVTWAVRGAADKRRQHFDRGSVLCTLWKTVFDLCRHPLFHLQQRKHQLSKHCRPILVEYTQYGGTPCLPRAAARSSGGTRTVSWRFVWIDRRVCRRLLSPWQRLSHCHSLIEGSGRRSREPNVWRSYGGDERIFKQKKKKKNIIQCLDWSVLRPFFNRQAGVDVRREL